MPRVRNAFAVLALATMLVACGSGTSQSPSAGQSVAASGTPAASDATAALLVAVEATLDEETVRVDQELEFVGMATIPNGTTASARGQASLGPPSRMRLEADFGGLGLGRLVMIRDESLVYMRGKVFDSLAGRGRWLVVDLDSNHPAALEFRSIASGQNDVSMALYYLYGAPDEVETGPGEVIGGQATTRYEMELDLEAARDSIPSDRAEALEDVIATLRVGGVERQLDGVVWVGEDGLVHRVRYEYRITQRAGGGRMVTVIDFDEFGAPMDLRLPRDRDVVSIEDVAA